MRRSAADTRRKILEAAYDLFWRQGFLRVSMDDITEQMDVPGVKERLIKEMSEIYVGNLFFGEDLMQIPVRGPAPAKLD